jgi:hypothetical protein
MSRTFHHGKNRKRKEKVQDNRRQRHDVRRMGRALLELTEAELEKSAECEHLQRVEPKKRGKRGQS